MPSINMPLKFHVYASYKLYGINNVNRSHDICFTLLAYAPKQICHLIPHACLTTMLLQFTGIPHINVHITQINNKLQLLFHILPPYMYQGQIWLLNATYVTYLTCIYWGDISIYMPHMKSLVTTITIYIP